MTMIGFVAACVIPFIVYLLMLSPFAAFGDSPEFITAAAILGIPHAPGYPLYMMIAHVFTKLPWGTVAWRVNLVSAVFASLAAGFVYLSSVFLVRQMLAKLKPVFVQLTAFAGVMILAFSPLFWLNAIVAEVFSLNCFFAALLITLILVWREKRLTGNPSAKKWFYVFAFTAGLPMTHHYTIGFLLFGFLYLIYKTDRTYMTDLNVIVPSVLMFFLGLLPLAYLPLSASGNPMVNWGDAKTAGDIWRIIARHDYKNPLSVASSALGPEGLVRQIPYFASVMVRHIGWMLVLAVPAGVFLFSREKQRRTLAVFIFLLYLISGPAFVIFATGYQTEIAVRAAIMERFFLLSEVPLAIILSLGLAWLINVGPQIVGFGLFALVFLGVCTKAGIDYPFIDQKNVDIFEYHTHAVMAHLPTETLYISYGDDLSFGIDLQQMVYGIRPDMTHVRNNMLSAPWYRRQIQERIPNLLLPERDILVSFGVHWARNELIMANVDMFPSIAFPLIPSPEAKRDLMLLPVYDSYLAVSYQKPFDLEEYKELVDRQLDELEPIIKYFKLREYLYKRIDAYPYLAWEYNIRSRLINSLLQEGIFLLENNEPGEALTYLTKSGSIEESFYSASNIAIAYNMLRDWDNALVYYAKALGFFPRDRATILAMIKICDEKGDLKKINELKILLDSASP